MINAIAEFNTVVNNKYLYVLLFFIMFDIVTGTLKAFSTNTVYSKINKQGITNHITIFLFCFFFTWVFHIFDVEEYSIIMTIFYIGSYGLSIIENIGQMGLPLPKWLVEKFTELQDETNRGVKSDETERNK